MSIWIFFFVKKNSTCWPKFDNPSEVKEITWVITKEIIEHKRMDQPEKTIFNIGVEPTLKWPSAPENCQREN